jgi:hypothetical protein
VTTTSPTTNTAGTTSPTATISSVNPTQAFTASGTFTVPNGAGTLTVELWGAGAGGAGSRNAQCLGFACTTAPGHGGGGGAYTRVALQVPSGTTLSIVIGVGGMGGAAGANGIDGSSTQVIRDGNVLAAAAGGKGDGTGGTKSNAADVFGLAGLDGTTAGAGGAMVPGSIVPVGTTGGAGGSPPGGCHLISFGVSAGQMACDTDGRPGAAGLSGYALVSWDLLLRRAP